MQLSGRTLAYNLPGMTEAPDFSLPPSPHQQRQTKTTPSPFLQVSVSSHVANVSCPDSLVSSLPNYSRMFSASPRLYVHCVASTCSCLCDFSSIFSEAQKLLTETFVCMWKNAGDDCRKIERSITNKSMSRWNISYFWYWKCLGYFWTVVSIKWPWVTMGWWWMWREGRWIALDTTAARSG